MGKYTGIFLLAALLLFISWANNVSGTTTTEAITEYPMDYSYDESTPTDYVEDPVLTETIPDSSLNTTSEGLQPVMKDLYDNYRGTFQLFLRYVNSSTLRNRRKMETVLAKTNVLRFNQTNLEGAIEELKSQVEGSGALNLNDRLSAVENVVAGMGDIPNATENGGSIFQNIARLHTEQMLTFPRAKLYSGKNLTGDSEIYNSARTGEGGCYDLQDLKQVKSVDTMDKCVRVFASEGCTGWSAAIYPGSDAEASLRFLNSNVTSVGPCLPDEFQSSTFYTEDQTFVKDASDLRNNIPDLAEFLSLDKYQRKSKGESFVLGPNRRTEFVRVSLRKRNLPETDVEVNEMDASEENQLHPMTGSEPGDIVGMMQPASLGGLSTNDWNVFPQTPSGKKAWLQETSDVRPYLNRSDDNWVTLHTNVMYENDESTRPYAFYYFLVYGNGNVVERRAYGHIAN